MEMSGSISAICRAQLRHLTCLLVYNSTVAKSEILVALKKKYRLFFLNYKPRWIIRQLNYNEIKRILNIFFSYYMRTGFVPIEGII